MSIFVLAGEFDDVLPTLFPTDATGHIQFGFAGRSAVPHAALDVVNNPIRINDYIMEGGVKYLVSAHDDSDGVAIEVHKLGTNRDDSVDWFVRRWIQQRGCEILSEAETTS